MTTEGAASEFVRAASVEVNPWLIAVVVSLAAFIEVLDTSVANVALPHMSEFDPEEKGTRKNRVPFDCCSSRRA